MRRIAYVLSVGATLATVAASALAQQFEHTVSGEATPWTEPFQTNGSSDLTFVLHSDLTGGEREGIFELAARQMALLRPEFVISVGDLIEGGGDRDALIAEWESFDGPAAVVRLWPSETALSLIESAGFSFDAWSLCRERLSPGLPFRVVYPRYSLIRRSSMLSKTSPDSGAAAAQQLPMSPMKPYSGAAPGRPVAPIRICWAPTTVEMSLSAAPLV